MNRCLNDPMFGYCYGKPQPVDYMVTIVDYDYCGREIRTLRPSTYCLNNHRTCSQYLTLTQLQAFTASQGTPPSPIEK